MSLVGAEHHVVNAVNVRAAPFSASGNGVTNDTAAVQAAIDAASASNRRVYFPAGGYNVDELSVTKSVLLEGEHPANTYGNLYSLGHVSGYVGACLKSRSGGTILHYTGGRHHWGGFRGLGFAGGSPILFTGMIEDVQNFTLEDVSFEDTTGWCLDNSDVGANTLGAGDGLLYQFRWSKIKLTKCAKGFLLRAGPSAMIDTMYVDGLPVGGYGLDVTGGNLLLNGINFGSNQGFPDPGTNSACCLRLTNIHATIINGQFEAYSGCAIRLDNTVSLHVIDSDFLDGLRSSNTNYSQTGIEITAASDKQLTISGRTKFVSDAWKNGTPLHQTAGSGVNVPPILLMGVPASLAYDGVPHLRLSTGATSAINCSIARGTLSVGGAATFGGSLTLKSGVWNMTDDAAHRLYFVNLGTTYVAGWNSVTFRNALDDGDMAIVKPEGFIFPSLPAHPASPSERQVYYNSTDKHYYGWNGTAWKQLDN